MDGTGVPLATPFDADGDVDEAALRDLVAWVEERGIDFIVPCGSNSEAELMTLEERARVVEVVCDAAEVPVLAGTGHPGLRETLRSTERAADAGAAAALVITPFYYTHDQETVRAYFEDLVDAASLPIYLYNVPAYTGTPIEPNTVAALADHENVRGMKDSTGDIERFQRERERVSDDFDLLVGHGSVYAAALDAGADGGVLAMANVVPDRAGEVYDRYRAGEREEAREINRALVELNHAVTARYSVPGLKAAMRSRGAPAGRVRSPHRPVGEAVERELAELVEAAGPSGADSRTDAT